MTTKVTVEANCGGDKCCDVRVLEAGLLFQQHTLEDGESVELFVHDDKEVVVKEYPKAAQDI